MTEHSSIVKAIFPKQSPNGKSYWQVVWNDDSKDNIFNTEWMSLLKTSLVENRIVNFTREPTPDGKFRNIKSVAFATLPTPPAPQPIAPQTPQDGQGVALHPPSGTGGQPPKPEMTKGEWAEKDKITRRSIQLQSCLKASVELAGYLVNIRPEKVTSENVIATTDYFFKSCENILAGEEVQPAKNKLVEEAKKLGATEIKKEGGDATP